MHFRARSYDPRLGRFLQLEPLLEERVRAQFVYVGNRPTMSRDPLGLNPQDSSEVTSKIPSDYRLNQSWEFLKAKGWKIKRTSLWFANSKVDKSSKTVLIDDDDEGQVTMLRWVRDGVRKVFYEDDDLRRTHIQDFARQKHAIRWQLTSAGAMIETYEFASWLAKGINQLTRDTRLVLAGDGTHAHARRGGKYYVGPWSDTGFKAEFRDDGDQVQHFAISFRIQSSSGIPAAALNFFTENRNEADYWFNRAIREIANEGWGTPDIWEEQYAGTGKIRSLLLFKTADFREVGPAPGTAGRPAVKRD